MLRGSKSPWLSQRAWVRRINVIVLDDGKVQLWKATLWVYVQYNSEERTTVFTNTSSSPFAVMSSIWKLACCKLTLNSRFWRRCRHLYVDIRSSRRHGALPRALAASASCFKVSINYLSKPSISSLASNENHRGLSFWAHARCLVRDELDYANSDVGKDAEFPWMNFYANTEAGLCPRYIASVLLIDNHAMTTGRQCCALY